MPEPLTVVPDREADELPPGWTLTEIARGAPPLYRFDLTGVSVLAWEIHVDGAFCCESCLVLRVLPKNMDDGRGRWCLAHLYRHPRLPDPLWSVSWVLEATPDDPFAHDWISHSTRLRGPVNNAAVYAALDRVDWSFDAGGRRTHDLVGRRVCERSWEAAIGEKPTRLYGQ